MKTQHKSVKMDPVLVERINQWCVKEDRSFNWFISKAAEERLQVIDKERAPTSYARAGVRAVESGERKCRDKKHCAPQKAVNS